MWCRRAVGVDRATRPMLWGAEPSWLGFAYSGWGLTQSATGGPGVGSLRMRLRMHEVGYESVVTSQLQVGCYTKRLWRAFPSGRWRPSFTAVPFHASRSQRESSVLQHTASLAMARDRTNTDALRYALAAANVSATCPQPTRNAPSACRSGMNLNAAEFSDYTEQVLCRAVPQRLLSPSVPRFVPTRHAPRCAAGGRGPLQHVQGVRSR